MFNLLILAMIAVWAPSAKSADLKCGAVLQTYRIQYEVAEKQTFLGVKKIPDGLLLLWTDGPTTTAVLFLDPGKILDGSKLFKPQGVCSLPDGQESAFYMAQSKNEPT